VTAFVALALSACGGGTATESSASTPTEPPEATALVSITEEPATTEAVTTAPATDTAVTAVTDTPGTPASPTVDPSIPTNPPDCTNSALFVTDVTIPDNTNMVGGTVFTKTWRISNNGTCVWGPTYTLNHYSDERLGAPLSVPLGLTYPGQTLDISVELTAPNTTGTHRGNFVIENPQGLIMKVADDSRLWVIINVTSVSAPTVAVSATPIGPSATLAGTVTPTPTGPTPTQGSANLTTASCAFTTDRTKLTEVITAVNAYRARNGLPAYTVNSKLAEAAQRHANDIACHKIYVHTGTDGSTPRSRVADTGYVAKSVSENVNGNYPPLDGQGAVNWWINDKTDATHGRNLLSTTFTEIGVGYAFFDNYGFYALVFAQP
ncbi:MAG TPA: CAP domain-containing protein, partial [Anaerolineales bacterium]|nr:CAP domain-containing protein [Anaerolineales bacterium]